MKILVTIHPGQGHFNSVAPLCNSLKKRGHEVIFATADCFKPYIEKRGFKHISAGLNWDETDLEGTIPECKNIDKVKLAEWMLEDIFLWKSPIKMVPDILEFTKQWKPDLIISEYLEWGGMIASEILEIPCVCCNIIFYWDPIMSKILIGKHLASLRKHFNLKKDPFFRMITKNYNINFFLKNWKISKRGYNKHDLRYVFYRVFRGPKRILRISHLFLGILMRIMSNFEFIFRMKHCYIQPSTFLLEEPDKELPEWFKKLNQSYPIIFLSLGTVFNTIYPEAFKVIIDSFQNKPFNLIVSLGDKNADITKFKNLPDNIHVENFFNLSTLQSVISKTDLHITQGGASTLNILRYGIPIVILPLSADEPLIASLFQSYNVAVSIHPKYTRFIDFPTSMPYIDISKIDGNAVYDAVQKVFQSDKYFKSAKKFQKKLLSLQHVDFAAIKIEEFEKDWREN